MSKRLYRPWLDVKWIRKFTKYDQIIETFRKINDNVVSGVSIHSIYDIRQLMSLFSNNSSIAFTQIIKRSIEQGSGTDSFIDKLIEVSKENDDFTINDIKVEAQTFLIGVIFTEEFNWNFSFIYQF